MSNFHLTVHHILNELKKLDKFYFLYEYHLGCVHIAFFFFFCLVFLAKVLMCTSFQCFVRKAFPCCTSILFL